MKRCFVAINVPKNIQEEIIKIQNKLPEFYGKKIEIAKQIGNAVPPLLAARVADSVYALMLQKEGIREL